MGWNHRVLRHVDRNPLHDKNPDIPEFEEWYGIHEVFYDEDGKGGVGYTTKPIRVEGDSVEDLKWMLQRMLEALDKPVLEYKNED